MATLDFSTQTTLVTGASSGIGRALARELASRGSDLVLVARRLDRLEALADDLRAAHHADVQTVSADLSARRPGPMIQEELARRGVRITSLINNAGFGSDGALENEDPEVLADMIGVDVAAVVDLTHTFLPDLRAADNGMLINVTSDAGYQPIPGMAAYAASKAFVIAFTEALWWELRKTGIRTLAFAPGLTDTEFFDRIGAEQDSGSTQTPEQVAAAAIRAISRTSPGPVAQSRRSSAVARWVVGLLSRRLRLRLIARVTGAEQLMQIRREYAPDVA